MKKIYSQLLLTMFTLIVITGCKEDDELHTNVSPVANLYAPEDNTFFNLGAQSTAVFEWEAAKAEDNGVVLYDVVFDLEDGDFSDPLYVVPADGNGLQRMLSLSFAELNKIAGMAGIAPEATGKLKWTVWSSKGINVKETTLSRIIEVERPAGFPPPAELYITGTATEGGDDLSQAILMKQTSASIFEIYTSLKPGEYSFASRNTGTPDVFFIEGDKLKADGTTTYDGEEKVYRVRLDFSNGTTEVTEITTVELWFPPFGEFLFELTYAGNGIWEALNKPIEFKQEDWGRDERYKFRFMITTGGSVSEEWFGSSNRDNQRATDDSPASYYYMVPDLSGSDWDYTFKFNGNIDMNNADIKVMFNTDVPEYTHSVTLAQ